MNEFELSGSHDVGYDPDSGAYNLQHNWDSAEPVSYTVTKLLLAVTGEEPDGGTPLSETVDPDALDRVFEPDMTSSDPDDHVTFTHQGCTVTVRRDGRVLVYPSESRQLELSSEESHPESRELE